MMTMANTDSVVILSALFGYSAAKYAVLWLMRNTGVKEYVGNVSEIFVYPLKSGKALEGVTAANITKHGVTANGVGDRYVFRNAFMILYVLVYNTHSPRSILRCSVVYTYAVTALLDFQHMNPLKGTTHGGSISILT